MADDVIAGRYRLRELLGSGPMSEVWAAEDAELERPVALKLLAPDADRARFEREARAAASLADPHIMQLFDYGETEGRPYMVLEYLPGGTLEELLRGGRRLPDPETRQVAAEIATGLAHAHARGLVHRDLKPANILFDAEGRAKIADFGIARLGGSSGTLTEAGTVLGTAAYISPEQAVGEIATPASDVYSVGVILYRMLSGRLPFEAEQPLALLELHRDAPPPSLDLVRPDVPRDLAAVAMRSLAKDPADRPADGSALVAALGSAPRAETTAGASTAVLPAAVAAAPPPPRRRFPIGAAAAAAILLAGGGALAYAVTRPGNASAPPSTLPTTIARRTLPKLKTAVTTHQAATAAPPPTGSPATATHPTTAATTATTRQNHGTTANPVPPVPPPTTAPPTTQPATTAASVPATTAATATAGTGTTAGP